MHGARPNSAARLAAMSATPVRTSCSVSPSPSFSSCSKRWASRRANPWSGPGVPMSRPRTCTGPTTSPGRDWRPRSGHVEVPGRAHLVGLGDGHEGGLRHAREVSRGVRRGLLRASRRPATARRGRVTHDGRAASWKTSWSAERMVAPVASGSPVPVLRQNSGWAPLETCRRIRWPALNVFAVGHMAMSSRKTPSSSFCTDPGESRMMPSLRLTDSALLRDVAQPHEEVRVLERRAQVQRRRQRADDREVLGEHRTGVGQHVVAVLAPALVLAAGACGR